MRSSFCPFRLGSLFDAGGSSSLFMTIERSNSQPTPLCNLVQPKTGGFRLIPQWDPCKHPLPCAACRLGIEAQRTDRIWNMTRNVRQS